MYMGSVGILLKDARNDLQVLLLFAAAEHRRALLDLADALDHVERVSLPAAPECDPAAHLIRFESALHELDRALSAWRALASPAFPDGHADRSFGERSFDELRTLLAQRIRAMKPAFPGDRAGSARGYGFQAPPDRQASRNFDGFVPIDPEPAPTAAPPPAPSPAPPAAAPPAPSPWPSPAGDAALEAFGRGGPLVAAGPPDKVSFIASAPPAARPGDEFIARLAAFLPADDVAVRTALAEASAHARTSPRPSTGNLERGTEVEMLLEGTGLAITGAGGRPVRTFTWDGTPQIVEFDVSVPADALPRTVVLKFHFRIGGIALDRVALELEIGTSAAAAATVRSTDARQLPATAFASYSSIDRPRVLDRVAAIRIAAHIDVFLDCMDLNPGHAWEPRLSQEIRQRDLFLLFWSEAAQRSRWVTWEWEEALRTKGIGAMQIQPLENGVKAPQALRAVHMADPYVDLRQAELARRGGDQPDANT